MSVIGRVLTVVSALLLLSIVLGGVWLLWGPGSLEYANSGVDMSLLVTMDTVARLVATAALSLVGLLAVSALLASVRGPSRPRLIELYAGDHESVLVAPVELERQLETVARDAERVYEAKAQVHPAGNRSVSVDIALDVEPEAELSVVVADVQERMATALAARYGISFERKPRIQVHYARDRDDRRHRGARPAASDESARR